MFPHSKFLHRVLRNFLYYRGVQIAACYQNKHMGTCGDDLILIQKPWFRTTSFFCQSFLARTDDQADQYDSASYSSVIFVCRYCPVKCCLSVSGSINRQKPSNPTTTWCLFSVHLFFWYHRLHFRWEPRIELRPPSNQLVEVLLWMLLPHAPTFGSPSPIALSLPPFGGWGGGVVARQLLRYQRRGIRGSDGTEPDSLLQTNPRLTTTTTMTVSTIAFIILLLQLARCRVGVNSYST